MPYLPQAVSPPPFKLLRSGLPSPAFFAPLTHSLVARVGGVDATFTRAGTDGTISDWEDIIKDVGANEARFQGARRVENLNTTSVFADWSLLSATVTATGDSAPSGQSGTVYRVQGTASTDWYVRQSLAVTAGNDYVQSFWVKSNTGSDQTFRINSGGKVSGNITATANWQRFSSQQTSTGGGATGLTRDSSQSAVDVLIYGPLSEEVTGQSNTNPSEYVSKGVGVGSEEVTNGTFDTDVSGWTAYDANASASWVAGEMDIDTTAINKGMYQTKTLISGHMYSFEGEVTLNSASQVKMGIGTGIGNFSMTTAKSVTSGSTGKISAVFRATQAAAWINIQIDTSGQDIRVDNVSVKSADHGANVDGVKFFDTENGNTVSSNVVTEATGTPLTTQDGVLIEKQRTNDYGVSSDYTPFTDINSSAVANQDTAPDGTLTADTLHEASTTASEHYGRVDSGLNNDTDYTYSVYVKPINRTWVALWFRGNAATIYQQSYQLTGSGTLGTPINSPVGTSIEAAGNGYYRCSITIDSGSGASTPRFWLYAAEGDGDINFNGLDQDSLYIWGIQREAGSFPTSYIPTTSIAETRNKSIASYDLTPAVNDITIAATWTPREDSGDTHFIWSSYSDASNYIALLYDGTDVIFRKRLAGVNNDATKTTNIVNGTAYRVVGRLDDSAGVDVWVDTVKGTNDNTATDAVVGTTIEIGSDGNGANQSAMNVKDVKYYTSALNDAGAAAA